MAMSFNDALRRRLSAIDEMGSSQSTWERLRNAREREKELQNQGLDWQESIANRLAIQQSNANSMQNGLSAGFGAMPGLGGAFGSFMQAIAGKESGGNYGALNRHSGAMGKYQIMPGNIQGRGRGWDYEALGRDISTSQFMASPQIQEKIARYKLQQYYNRYGPAGAAIAWYAGPGAANRYASSGQVSNSMEANGYPSVQAYVNAILSRL